MGDPRPVIGIVAATEQARYTVWDNLCALLPMAYVEAVQRAGGIVLMIPPDPALADDPSPILDRIDGLLLAGGSDIDPSSYGAPADPHTTGTTPARDAAEIALVHHAIERHMPVLGICRGMQLLNVALGGTLVQHVPDVVGHEQHRRRLGTFLDNDHMVLLESGSLAAEAAGEQRHAVKSHHHQAISAVGDGLLVSGHSDLDDLPEAIEGSGDGYLLGVQWHPEVDPDSQVVGSLVQRASAYQASQRSTTPL